MRFPILFSIFNLPFLFMGCAKDSESDTATATVTDEDATQTGAVYQEMEGVDSSMCGQDYSVCGDLLVPFDLEGSARSLAIALYTSLPPAGPPDGIVVQIDAPDIMSGYRFPIREMPVLYTGEYYLWVNLYMEGGGEWTPVNGVDFTGSTSTPVVLDGTPIEFGDIELELASGW